MSSAFDSKKQEESNKPKLKLPNLKKGIQVFNQGKTPQYILLVDKQKYVSLVMSPFSIFLLLLSTTCIFLIVFTTSVLSHRVIQQEIRYDNINECNIGFNDPKYGKECVVDLEVKEKIDLPVDVFYELGNFYQSHSTFMKSFSRYQQRGDVRDSYRECTQVEKIDGKIVYPCGIMPSSTFSDVIIGRLKTKKGETIEFTKWEGSNRNTKDSFMWRKKGIAWLIDKEEKKNMDINEDFNKKFIRTGPEQKKINEQIGEEKVLLPLPEDEDLLVWQRVSPWSRIRKLYRRIERLNESLGRQYFVKGDIIQFKIQNYFKVDGINQNKKIIISTITKIGPTQKTIVYISLGIACFSFVAAISVFLNYLIFPRKFADITRIQ